jgi:drug/metabolite transporter (DMT)-like permease
MREAEPRGDPPAGADAAERRRALILLVVIPAFFGTNMLVARAVAGDIPPVALAFWRWTLVFALLAPWTVRPLWRQRHAVRREWRDLALLGAFGMGVCGAFVYVGAETTTATNIGLNFGASPILIVLLTGLGGHERLTQRQLAGVVASLAGVLVLIFRGDPAALLAVRLVPGDLWIACASAAWAGYAVILRYRPSALDPATRFAAVTLYGCAIMAPFHLAEALAGDLPAVDPTTRAGAITLGAIALVAVVPGIGAYQGYARIQRTLGAATTGLVLYLTPLYTALLAWLLLDEALDPYHLVGAALILPGIWLATRRPVARR